MNVARIAVFSALTHQGTPDIVSFLIFDGAGKRMAYGTGPVVDGDLEVTDTSN
jgi:hypothetical protein